MFYADLDSGIINEFLLPECSSGILPNGLTIRGFGEDNGGELYVLATNTPSSGAEGVVYALRSVPEPAAFIRLGIGAVGLLTARRRCKILRD